MTKRILVAGASGALGLETVRLLKQKDLEVRGLVHSMEGTEELQKYTTDIWAADASEGTHKIKDVTEDIHTVISAMGKSVSLFSNDDHSFKETDFFGNTNLLDDAVRNGVKRFIYISIKGADTGVEYEIAKAHKRFEEALQSSEMDHTIIRPVGFFSGLNDLAIMAKRKLIPIVGDGEAKTNSIHQKDLAEVVVEYLEEGPNLVEVGGPLIHTRLEMAEMLQDKIGGKIIKIPEKVAEWGMFLPEMISDSMGDKLNYFKYITTRDMVGERRGKITYQEYLNTLDLDRLP